MKKITALHLFLKQYVSIDGLYSQTKIVICGVPLGSTLGPLLFLIYINNFTNALQKCNVHHFTNDTNFINGNKEVEILAKN